MKPIRVCFFMGLFGVAVGSACVHTKTGTHVEVIEMNGRPGYVSGAAGVGNATTSAVVSSIFAIIVLDLTWGLIFYLR